MPDPTPVLAGVLAGAVAGDGGAERGCGEEEEATLMPLLYIRRYTRKLIQAHPDWLFVFGDNLRRTGRAGQAAEARGEPNAVGIATKHAPGLREQDFFTDDDMALWVNAEKENLFKLNKHIASGGVVIWPLDSIGTGLSELPKRAPKLYELIESARRDLETVQ